jgi:hypothetical protein
MATNTAANMANLRTLPIPSMPIPFCGETPWSVNLNGLPNALPLWHPAGAKGKPHAQ